VSRLSRTTLLLACFLAVPALAKQADEPRLVLDADTSRAELGEQRARIEAAIKEDEYSELDRTGRNELRDDLDAIEAVFPEQGPLRAAPAANQAQVAELGEDVNKLLDRAFADSRVTCAREQQIGSAFPKRVCTTAAQRKRQQTGINEMSRNGRSSPTVESAPSN
jgi:hypothetical protein